MLLNVDGGELPDEPEELYAIAVIDASSPA